MRFFWELIQEHFSFCLLICQKIHKILGCLEDIDASMEIIPDKFSCKGSQHLQQGIIVKAGTGKNFFFCCLTSNPFLYLFCKWILSPTSLRRFEVKRGKMIAACRSNSSSPPPNSPPPNCTSASRRVLALSMPSKKHLTDHGRAC